MQGMGLNSVIRYSVLMDFTGDNVTNKLKGTESEIKSLSLRLSQLGNQLLITGGMFTTLFTVPIISGFKRAINESSDYNEALNKIEVVYGDLSSKAMDWAISSQRVFGLSKVEALDSLALYGDMATGMGFASDEALNLATSISGMIRDVGSFKNMSDEMVATGLKGIFTGETESIKNLGVVMTQANVANWAFTQGLYDTESAALNAYKNMSQTEKVMLRFKFVTDALTNSQGDFNRTLWETWETNPEMVSFANIIKYLGSVTKDVAVIFGDVLRPKLGNFLMEVLIPFLDNLRDLPEEEVETLVDAFLKLASIPPIIMAIGGTLKLISGFITGGTILKEFLSGVTLRFLDFKDGIVDSGLSLLEFLKIDGAIIKFASVLKNNLNVETFKNAFGKLKDIKLSNYINVKGMKSKITNVFKSISIPKFKSPDFTNWFQGFQGAGLLAISKIKLNWSIFSGLAMSSLTGMNVQFKIMGGQLLGKIKTGMLSFLSNLSASLLQITLMTGLFSVIAGGLLLIGGLAYSVYKNYKLLYETNEEFRTSADKLKDELKILGSNILDFFVKISNKIAEGLGFEGLDDGIEVTVDNLGVLLEEFNNWYLENEDTVDGWAETVADAFLLIKDAIVDIAEAIDSITEAWENLKSSSGVEWLDEKLSWIGEKTGSGLDWLNENVGNTFELGELHGEKFKDGFYKNAEGEIVPIPTDISVATAVGSEMGGVYKTSFENNAYISIEEPGVSFSPADVASNLAGAYQSTFESESNTTISKPKVDFDAMILATGIAGVYKTNFETNSYSTIRQPGLGYEPTKLGKRLGNDVKVNFTNNSKGTILRPGQAIGYHQLGAGLGQQFTNSFNSKSKGTIPAPSEPDMKSIGERLSEALKNGLNFSGVFGNIANYGKSRSVGRSVAQTFAAGFTESFKSGLTLLNNVVDDAINPSISTLAGVGSMSVNENFRSLSRSVKGNPLTGGNEINQTKIEIGDLITNVGNDSNVQSKDVADEVVDQLITEIKGVVT